MELAAWWNVSYNQWNGHDWNACDVAVQVRRSPSEKSAADSSVHPSTPPATRSHPARAPTPAARLSFSFSRVTRLKLPITISPCLWLLNLPTDRVCTLQPSSHLHMVLWMDNYAQEVIGNGFWGLNIYACWCSEMS